MPSPYLGTRWESHDRPTGLYMISSWTGSKTERFNALILLLIETIQRNKIMHLQNRFRNIFLLFVQKSFVFLPTSRISGNFKPILSFTLSDFVSCNEGKSQIYPPLRPKTSGINILFIMPLLSHYSCYALFSLFLLCLLLVLFFLSVSFTSSYLLFPLRLLFLGSSSSYFCSFVSRLPCLLFFPPFFISFVFIHLLFFFCIPPPPTLLSPVFFSSSSFFSSFSISSLSPSSHSF